MALLRGRLLTDSGCKEVSGFYAGDYLSMVISHAPFGCAWFTVMNNVNVAGVAALAEISLIVICGKSEPDETMLARCDERGISVMITPLDVFAACARVGGYRVGGYIESPDDKPAVK
ncbi:MAG: DRTGG domain-containing protein [Firmicutes bacterium]|nr:DRTGG domain-containing protein [Bacillota bacterium]